MHHHPPGHAAAGAPSAPHDRLGTDGDDDMGLPSFADYTRARRCAPAALHRDTAAAAVPRPAPGDAGRVAAAVR